MDKYNICIKQTQPMKLVLLCGRAGYFRTGHLLHTTDGWQYFSENRLYYSSTNWN